MRIFLIGYMGSGKSLFSRLLSMEMCMACTDTDREIERMEGMTVEQIFASKGESAFRECERRVLESFQNRDDIIVATGGGLPCHGNNMDMIRSLGVSVYLRVPPEELASRLMRSSQKRPLLEGKNPGELLTFIKEHLSEREKTYKLADRIFDASGKPVSELVGILKETLLNQTNNKN